jgi:hypothetical protein
MRTDRVEAVAIVRDMLVRMQQRPSQALELQRLERIAARGLDRLEVTAGL